MHIPAQKTLVLSPTTSFANPRAWKAVTGMNIVGQYDEVHCFGGGSLLLFLLACAGKSPRLCPGGKVVLHGPLIYPTPDSCKQWLVKENKKLLEDVDAYDWRQAALSLGVGGLLEEHRWLEPIVRSLTAGRHEELVEQYDALKSRTEEKGRLLHLEGHLIKSKSTEQELIQGLRRPNSDSEEHGQPARVLVRCGEFECEQLDGDESVTFRT